MKKTILFLIVVAFFSNKGFSQSTEIIPNQGVSVPQFTTVFINSMTTQPKGTVVFDSDLNVMKYYDGTTWQTMSGGGGVGWQVNANDISNTNSGNVGIGTISPLSKLTVNGSASLGKTTVGDAALSAGSGGAITAGGGFFVSHGESSGGPFPIFTNKSLQMDGSRIQAVSGILGNSSAARILINPFGGNVGINTGSNTVLSNLLVHKSTSANFGSAVFKGTTHYSHFHFDTNEDTYIRGGKDGSHVIINDIVGGNVGIGVYPYTYKLEVNGTARTKEVIVETGWADYVFEDNYKLKSIDELEAFVKENKHLPNIPKASEIETNGLKVGETNKAMMEKIEELALYIIQLKKEIDVLKAKN
ncbi:MAG: hypothetical protein MUF45_14955 [Spirosomaceae bacterium]|jgi:hypothetical protein|nr:hypothetical protein [Spirosomataceae bacterium]